MVETQHNSEMMSAAEAAQELGTTVLAVLMQIKRGRLQGVEQEGGWTVTRQSLEAFRADSGESPREHCRTACARKAHCGSCS